MTLFGEVKNKTAVIVDDIVDTAGTLIKAVATLDEAADVMCVATHGVFSTKDALVQVQASPLSAIFVTNTIPQEENAKICQKLSILDVGDVFSEGLEQLIL